MRIHVALRSSLKQIQPNPTYNKISLWQVRKMSSSSCTLDQTLREPVFSSNTDHAQATQDLKSLLNSTSSSGRWNLIENGKGIERSFKFKTFKKTWEFMNLVAAECSVQKHHPEWSNVYNTTFIRWTTHSPPGLSQKDITMARICDAKAAECGEQVQEVENETARGLVATVVKEGGDCCVPKKKIVT